MPCTESGKSHTEGSPGVVSHWLGSTHALKGVGCVDCHTAGERDVDAYQHFGERIGKRFYLQSNELWAEIDSRVSGKSIGMLARVGSLHAVSS